MGLGALGKINVPGSAFPLALDVDPAKCYEFQDYAIMCSFEAEAIQTIVNDDIRVNAIYTDERYLNGEFQVPVYASDNAAAMDFCACIDEPLTLMPGEQVMIDTGIRLDMPRTLACELLPRSGLGSRGLVLGNLTGLIDGDYQGNVKVVAWNRHPPFVLDEEGNPKANTSKALTIEPGERICQVLFIEPKRAALNVVDEFETTTKRGTQGFGHSGKTNVL